MLGSGWTVHIASDPLRISCPCVCCCLDSQLKFHQASTTLFMVLGHSVSVKFWASRSIQCLNALTTEPSQTWHCRWLHLSCPLRRLQPTSLLLSSTQVVAPTISPKPICVVYVAHAVEIMRVHILQYVFCRRSAIASRLQDLPWLHSSGIRQLSCSSIDTLFFAIDQKLIIRKRTSEDCFYALVRSLEIVHRAT